MSIDVSSMPFPAIGISCSPYPVDLRRHVRDRLHHGVPHAGIVERVAGAFDDTNLGIRPHGRKRMGCRRRAQQIVAALHDDARECLQLARVRHQLVRRHEAVVTK